MNFNKIPACFQTWFSLIELSRINFSIFLLSKSGFYSVYKQQPTTTTKKKNKYKHKHWGLFVDVFRSGLLFELH